MKKNYLGALNEALVAFRQARAIGSENKPRCAEVSSPESFVL